MPSDVTADAEWAANPDYATAERHDLGDIDISGGWKALFYNDPDNIANSFGYEFFKFTVSGDAENVSVALDWYLYSGESENIIKAVTIILC